MDSIPENAQDHAMAPGWMDGITPEDVDKRTRVGELAASDPMQALRIARSIRHPWYKCQSLSTVAGHWRDRTQKLKLLEEALAAAQKQQEINRIVTVSAWPLMTLARTDAAAAGVHLTRLAALADDEPHCLRRADALAAIAGAACSDPALLDIVLPSLSRALLAGRGWRIERLIRATVQMLNGAHPELAQPLLAHHTENGKKRKFLKKLAPVSAT